MNTLIKKNILAAFTLLLTFNLIGQFNGTSYSAQTYLIQFEPGTTPSEIELVKDSMNCEELWVSPITNTHYWKVESPFPYYNDSLQQFIIDINEQREVSQERAHVDEVDLNYFFNVGPNVSNPGTLNNYCYDTLLQFDGTPPLIKISILDTGFDGSNYGVTPTTFKNYLGSNPNTIKDEHGHGTFMFSIIEDAFMANSGLLPTSIKWDIRRTHNRKGRAKLAHIILALEEAVLDGANIVNMSFSYKDPNGIVSQDVMKHVMEVMETNNVLVVAAAGNDFEDLDNAHQDFNCFPAELPAYNVLTVGSLNCDNDSLSDFSNYGLYSVDITAPGEHIEGYSGKDLIYDQKSGTSHATAIVSGVAASLALNQPSFDYARIKCAILTGADYKPSLQGQILTSGFLNADEALNELLAGCTDTINTPYPLQGRQDIEISEEVKLMVYPNPVQDVLFVELKGELENAKLSLIGLNGQEVLKNVNIKGRSISIDVNEFPQGLYTIKITTSTKNIYQNVIIQK